MEEREKTLTFLLGCRPALKTGPAIPSSKFLPQDPKKGYLLQTVRIPLPKQKEEKWRLTCRFCGRKLGCKIQPWSWGFILFMLALAATALLGGFLYYIVEVAAPHSQLVNLIPIVTILGVLAGLFMIWTLVMLLVGRLPEIDNDPDHVLFRGKTAGPDFERAEEGTGGFEEAWFNERVARLSAIATDLQKWDHSDGEDRLKDLRARAFEIGRELHARGGEKLMLRAHGESQGGREIEIAWNGIGDWRG